MHSSQTESPPKPPFFQLTSTFSLPLDNFTSSDRTLVNSLRTWNSSGLLDMVSERVALLNDPLPAEHAMALHFGFDVLQPKDVPGGKVRFT